MKAVYSNFQGLNPSVSGNNSKNDSVFLHQIIEQFVKALLPVAVRNSSFIINDIPQHLCISGDASTLTTAIKGLLRSVVFNARETCIRISAKDLYSNTSVISVRDSNSFNTFAVACGLQDVLPLAQKLGGDIDIINEKQHITTIAFRFPLIQKTA